MSFVRKHNGVLGNLQIELCCRVFILVDVIGQVFLLYLLPSVTCGGPCRIRLLLCIFLEDFQQVQIAFHIGSNPSWLGLMIL